MNTDPSRAVQRLRGDDGGSSRARTGRHWKLPGASSGRARDTGPEILCRSGRRVHSTRARAVLRNPGWRAAAWRDRRFRRSDADDCPGSNSARRASEAVLDLAQCLLVGPHATEGPQKAHARQEAERDVHRMPRSERRTAQVRHAWLVPVRLAACILSLATPSR